MQTLLSMQEYFLQNIDSFGYVGLFVVCFLAATIIPFSSDFLFAAMVPFPQFSPWILIAVATAGNTAGGMTNYYIGKQGNILWIEKYLKIKEEKILKMQKWLQGKGGALMAFFSFAPFVGDVMAVALGYMRANTATVWISMTLGKLSRFIVVYYAMKYGIEFFN